MSEKNLEKVIDFSDICR